ncbi:MAG: YdjY domain-containing protein [Thermodesulfobacteriota bacterium]
MIRTYLVSFALVLVLVAGCSKEPAPSGKPFKGLTEEFPLQIDHHVSEIRFLADLQPAAFSGDWMTHAPRYHAVVWKGGGAAREALLSAYVDDATVYDALIALGAVPGNNLTMEAWTERKNKESSAPDRRVLGTPIEARVFWDGLAEPVQLKDMLVDSGGRGIDLRFGGNKELIPVWRSGCIVCLYSCPGGKVSNHAYTIRDYEQDVRRFSVNYSLIPEGSRRAVVILRVRTTAVANQPTGMIHE